MHTLRNRISLRALNLAIFWFSEDSPRVVRRPHKSFRTFSENSEDYQRFPKISVDYWRLPMKNRRCFDHTPTNLRYRNYRNFVRVRFLRTFLRAENISTAWEEVMFSIWGHDDICSCCGNVSHNNSPFQLHSHPDYHKTRTTDTVRSKSVTVVHSSLKDTGIRSFLISRKTS